MGSIKQYIIEGDTREEAIKKAELMLEVPRNKIKVEILSKGSNGFMGIGKKPVVIRVGYNGISDLEHIINNTLENKSITDEPIYISENKKEDIKGNDGTIAIKSGEVTVIAPQEFGKFPTIIAGDNVEVYVDGNKIIKPTIVTEDSLVEIKTLNTIPTAMIKVKISEDKMKANLIISKKTGKKFAIVDSGPKSETLVTTKCIAEEQPSNVNFDEIIDMLKDKGINNGINLEVIMATVASREEEIDVEVASGILPSGVEDASINYNFLD